MVEKQLQIMFHIDLVPNLSASRAKSEWEMSIGMSEGVGSAKEEPNERYSKVQRIIVLEGRYLQQVRVGWKDEQRIVVVMDGYVYMFPAGDGCVHVFPACRSSFIRNNRKMVR